MSVTLAARKNGVAPKHVLGDERVLPAGAGEGLGGEREGGAGVRGYETLVAPANMQIEPAGNAIALSWDANSEFDLMRYRIYVGADSTSLTLADSVAATDPTELLVRSLSLIHI